MKTKSALVLIGLAVYSQQLLASVSISFEFEALRNASGVPLDVNTLTILIADSDKNSLFPSASELFEADLAVGNDVAGNRIFFSSTTGSGGANSATLLGGMTSVVASDIGLSNNNEIGGTRWAVYWFPGLSTAPGSGGLQSGQSYGFYHSDQLESTAASLGATHSMVMPADGTTAATVMYFDTAIQDTSFPSVQDFSADLTVVPEPSTIAVLIMFSGILSLRRRR